MPAITLTHRFLPDLRTPGKLLIVLHGRGDSMAGFEWLPDALNLPDLGYLLVNAPDEYYGGFSWYDLPPHQGPGILRSRALLVELIDEVIARGWAPSDVVLFGFSQGCLMAADVGARTTHALGGVCGVSGYVYFEAELAHEVSESAKVMPWWISAGTEDQAVPLEQTRAGVSALRAAGLPIEFEVFRKPHTIDLVQELPAIRAWLNATLSRGSN